MRRGTPCNLTLPQNDCSPCRPTLPFGARRHRRCLNLPGAFRCLRPGTKNAALKLSVRGGGPRRLESETSSPLRGAFLYPDHAHRSEGWAARYWEPATLALRLVGRGFAAPATPLFPRSPLAPQEGERERAPSARTLLFSSPLSRERGNRGDNPRKTPSDGPRSVPLMGGNGGRNGGNSLVSRSELRPA